MWLIWAARGAALIGGWEVSRHVRAWVAAFTGDNDDAVRPAFNATGLLMIGAAVAGVVYIVRREVRGQRGRR